MSDPTSPKEYFQLQHQTTAPNIAKVSTSNTEICQRECKQIQYKINKELKEGDIEISQDRLELCYDKDSQSVPMHRSKSMAYSISTITEDDKMRVKQLIRRQEQYERKLEEQARMLEQEARMEEQRKKILKEQQRQKMFQQKIPLLQQNIEHIEKRNKQRKLASIMQNKKLKAIKSEKTLHQKLQQKWEKAHEQLIKQKQQKYNQLKKAKAVDFQEIRQHAIRHEEKLNEIKQSRASLPNIDKEVPHYEKSIFLSRVVEDDEHFRQKFDEKSMLAKQFAEKRKQYAQIVRDNYKPKVTQKSRLLEAPQKTVYRSMSHKQVVYRGNDYMREVNEQLRQHSKTNHQFKRQQSKKFTYPNYLTQLRMKKGELQKVEDKRVQQKYQTEVKKILSKSGISSQEKFLAAKLMTKKMQEPQVKKNPYKLIDSINAKIEILKHVS